MCNNTIDHHKIHMEFGRHECILRIDASILSDIEDVKIHIIESSIRRMFSDVVHKVFNTGRAKFEGHSLLHDMYNDPRVNTLYIDKLRRLLDDIPNT